MDDRTLEELDGQTWGEADPDATSLVRECHRLRKVPVRRLSNDGLRLLLGEQIGAEWLVSIALARLREEPLAGDLYPGDLLNAVLRTDSKYWETHADDLASLWAVRTALEQIGSHTRQLLDRNDWPSRARALGHALVWRIVAIILVIAVVYAALLIYGLSLFFAT